MKLYNQHLDKLGEGYDQILAFDCEFWRVSGGSEFSLIPKSTEFFTPRELAGFFIKKDEKGRWEYSGHFFVTFSPPKNKDISFVSSEFASVSAKTAEENEQVSICVSIFVRCITGSNKGICKGISRRQAY